MTLSERIAGAPITWGVSEVPGWGVQLPPVRVLAEMRELGLVATELGPDGFLPAYHADLAALLRKHDLQLAGGFVPAVLHVPALLPGQLEFVAGRARRIAAAGGDTMVLAATRPGAAYEGSRSTMSEDEWRTLEEGLARAVLAAGAASVRIAVHPHVGTVIEQASDVEQLLARTDAQLCLDTGHLAVGGVDVAELARTAVDRIGHVHLKDLDERVAARLRAGELGFAAAVQAGLFVPLGAGSLPIGEVLATLEQSGYDGWYVLEQDIALTSEREDPAANARASLEAMRQLTGQVRA